MDSRFALLLEAIQCKKEKVIRKLMTSLFTRTYFACPLLPVRSLLECVYVKLSCALEVCSLILVNNVQLCELVEHCSYLRQKCLSSALLVSVTQSLYSVTGGLVIKTVVCTLCHGLTNSLLR